MPNPLTKVEHKWVAIEVTPVDVYRRSNGEVVALKDPDTDSEIQIGCFRCDATPEEGWYKTCPGEDGQ